MTETTAVTESIATPPPATDEPRIDLTPKAVEMAKTPGCGRSRTPRW